MQMSALKPCPYRHADDEGHILCDKIKTGDREVSPNVCRDCPIAAINCAHLRATLNHHAPLPITVRWGNGKTDVLEDDAPALALQRAACAAKVTPILSPRECAGCPLRKALAIAEILGQSATTNRRRQSAAMPAPIAPAPQPAAIQPAPTANARSNIVAAKIIQLQEWLAKQQHTPRDAEDGDVVRPIAAVRPAQAAGEEKRVGWTD